MPLPLIAIVAKVALTKAAGAHVVHTAACHASSSALTTAAQVGGVIGGVKAARDLTREREKSELRQEISRLQSRYNRL